MKTCKQCPKYEEPESLSTTLLRLGHISLSKDASLLERKQADAEAQLELALEAVEAYRKQQQPKRKGGKP